MPLEVALDIQGKVPEDLFGRELAVCSAWEEFLKTRCELPSLVSKVEVGVTFVEDEQMIELNLKYRGIDSVTDVLSFPLWEEGGVFVPPNWQVLPLGDVVVCPGAVESLDGSFTKGLLLVIHHGFLHLLGYDHVEDEEREVMWRLQDELVERTV
ncbi:MAG: rRNA maturation RNase YbeY [Thermanaerothrix sp.]|nr:rRNA maturation RNase YbeY [Thermanaerothrix sp.]